MSKDFFGIALVALNPLVGYGGIVLSAFFYKKNKERIFLYLGGASYMLSWVMLILGTVLAGPKAIKMAKTFIGENVLFALIILAVILVFLYIQRHRGKI